MLISMVATACNSKSRGRQSPFGGRVDGLDPGRLWELATMQSPTRTYFNGFVLRNDRESSLARYRIYDSPRLIRPRVMRS